MVVLVIPAITVAALADRPGCAGASRTNSHVNRLEQLQPKRVLPTPTRR
jgi:hypothetical protein